MTTLYRTVQENSILSREARGTRCSTANLQETPYPAEPLLVDSKTAAMLIGVGISTFYAMDRSGELGPPGVRLRRRRLWPREELAAWVQAGCPPRPQWLASQ